MNQIRIRSKSESVGNERLRNISKVYIHFNQNKEESQKSRPPTADYREGGSFDNMIEPFQSTFKPNEMRCLALVAHNNMKPLMKEFVEQRKGLLKNFRLTGTKTTIAMLTSVFEDDKEVVYGPCFNSGPLGGDAEVCALMCQEDLGGVLFFMDPLQFHPHLCDIETLIRLSNVHNVLLATNRTSAIALCKVLEVALREGRKDLIPSFFYTLESTGVTRYKEQQQKKINELKTKEQ